MEFLEQLYSNENFGLYLVIAIAVLVVLFFIVLFMGKKDQKASSVANEKTTEPVNNEQPVSLENNVEKVSVEENKNNVESPVILEQTAPVVEPPKFNPEPINPSLVAPEAPLFKEVSEVNSLEVKELPKEEVNLEKTQNVVMNEEVKPVIEENNEVEHKEFDFDALAEAINKELESFKESKPVEEPVSAPVKEEVKPVIEEKSFSFPTFESVEPDKIPEPILNNELNEVKPVIEEKPRPVMPNVFSSVYVNKEEPKHEEVKPVKPAAFELPKMADLPKKAEVKEPEIHSVFDSIEEESYQINK